MKNISGWLWRTIVKHVDIDTGEIINPETEKENYIKIKTTKHVEKNHQLHKGIIHITYECRRNPQGRLFR